MKGKFLMGALVLLGGLLLTGCGKDPSKQVVVFNYGEYMDVEVFEAFEKETGLEVVYEEYTTPEAMYSKYKAGTTDYDLICSTDYMVEKLAKEGELLEMDFDKIPNSAFVGETYWDMSKAFDPDNKYSMPYYWGTVGIVYDTTKVKEEVNSWDILWDEKYKGEIIMQNSIRDSFAVALKKLGYSINTEDKAQVEEAQKLLMDQSPLVQAYMVDEARESMIGSEAAMAVIYSGDGYLAMESNENLAYAVPEEGSNVWVDSWMIPKTCQNKEGAQLLLDYLYDVEVSRQNFDFVYYPTANEEFNKTLSEEELEIFPPQEIVDKCEVYTSLSDDGMKLYSDKWKEIKSAN